MSSPCDCGESQPPVTHMERHDEIWKFFKALNEGRVSLFPSTRKGGFRVFVTPPVQDAVAEVQDQLPLTD